MGHLKKGGARCHPRNWALVLLMVARARYSERGVEFGMRTFELGHAD